MRSYFEVYESVYKNGGGSYMGESSDRRDESLFTIADTRSWNLNFGFQLSFCFAVVGYPINMSTSDGLYKS